MSGSETWSSLGSICRLAASRSSTERWSMPNAASRHVRRSSSTLPLRYAFSTCEREIKGKSA
eukprot:1458460-Pleurochrysis_carterae.AAC.1